MRLVQIEEFHLTGNFRELLSRDLNEMICQINREIIDQTDNIFTQIKLALGELSQMIKNNFNLNSKETPFEIEHISIEFDENLPKSVILESLENYIIQNNITAIVID